jgi:AraC-like DNA-binding protein
VLHWPVSTDGPNCWPLLLEEGTMSVKSTYIRATSLIGLRELIEDAGQDPRALLRSANIDPEALDDVDCMISFGALIAMAEAAAIQLKRPSLGLEWSLRLPDHFPNVGPLVLLASFVETLEEFIQVGLKYWRYHTNGFTMQLLDDPSTGLGVFRYHADTSAFSTRQVCEHTLANLCMIARKVTDHPDDNPSLVRFQHSRPRDTSLHEQIFRCPIEFDADHTEYLFEPKILRYETNGRLHLLKPLMNLYVKYRVNRTSTYDGSVSATVSLTLLSVMGSGVFNIDIVAQSLGLSAKTLQRNLSAEGTNFSEIVEQVRKNMACRLLSESNASVERIAGLLEYSGTPPFTLAFKRWTGQTPLNFRSSQQRKVGL